MKAILQKEFGGPEVLYMGEYPEPTPKDDELLVRVKATALNRADILQRMGMYPPPLGTSPIIGLEMAGFVEKVGKKVNDWKVGDRVFAILPGGGYAEKVTIPAEMAMPIPNNLSFEQAASIAEVFLTAYLNLVWLGGMEKGKKVLIHAGASGVGTAAIQLVKDYGASSIVTVGSREKKEFCDSLGADLSISYKEGPFVPKLLEWTDQKGVDIILDCIGASYWTQNLKCAAMDSKIIIIGALGGGELEKVPLWELIKQRISVIGSSLRSRSLEEKIKLSKEFTDRILPKFKDGTICPIVDSVFDWHDVIESHQYLEQNLNIGKVVLRVY